MSEERYYELISELINKKPEEVPKIPISLFILSLINSIDLLNDVDYLTTIYEIGYNMGKLIPAKDEEDLKRIFYNLGLGELEITDNVVIVKNDPLYKYVDMKSHKNYFTGGFLSGVLSSIYNEPYFLEDVHCDGNPENCPLNYKNGECENKEDKSIIKFTTKRPLKEIEKME